MVITEKLNVRGALDSLKVKEELTLPKGEYIPSSVRSTAASLGSDTGKSFSVSVGAESIVVTRNK